MTPTAPLRWTRRSPTPSGNPWRTWTAAAPSNSKPDWLRLRPGWAAERSRMSGRNQLKEVQMRGVGRVIFAATLLLIAGTLNIIYGIGALDDANIFVNDNRFILTNLNTLGWVLIILGVIQLAG